MTAENNALVFSSVFLVKNPPNDERISQLADWGKKLRGSGIVQGTEGNLSFRTRLGFIITGTNVPVDSITPETASEITGVVYGLHKTSVYVKGMAVPSRETLLHSQIYEERPDVNAIFHVHDTAMMKKAEKLGIPVTTEEKPAGSLELAKEASSLLKLNKEVNYFILKSHGCIALGGTVDEAGRLVEEMRERG